MDEITVEKSEYKFISPTFTLEAKAQGSDMTISGYASTSDLDYSGDVVLPTAFSKTLDKYRIKGRYWFNHDKNMPIGRVEDIVADSKGLYIEKAVLAETKINREWLWPLIECQAINEHSIQFLSKKPERKDGIRYHTEAELLETSAVTLAMNSGAVMDSIKSLISVDDYKKMMDEEESSTLDILRKLFEFEQTKTLKSDTTSTYAVDGFKKTKSLIMDTQTTQVVDFMDLICTENKSLVLDKGEPISLPSKADKRYEEVCEAVFLAKSQTRNSYLFQVGVPTEKGFAYSFDLVAMSLGSVLGARGSVLMTNEQKENLIARFAEIYKELGKTLPTYEGVAINNVRQDIVGELKYTNVEFKENEQDIVSLTIANNNLTALNNISKHYNKTLPETVEKSVYSSINMYFSIYPDDEKDFEFLQTLISAYAAYKAEKEDESCEGGISLMSFGKYLEDINKPEGEKEVPIEEVAKPEEKALILSLDEEFIKILS